MVSMLTKGFSLEKLELGLILPVMVVNVDFSQVLEIIEFSLI